MNPQEVVRTAEKNVACCCGAGMFACVANATKTVKRESKREGNHAQSTGHEHGSDQLRIAQRRSNWPDVCRVQIGDFPWNDDYSAKGGCHSVDTTALFVFTVSWV
jgi:hypothetical protein